VTALPARHFSGRSLFNRFQTLWASFVLAGLSHRVYYGADSGEWPGFAEIGKQFGPFNLTMLEIGAYDPAWANIHMGQMARSAAFAPWEARGYSCDPLGSIRLGTPFLDPADREGFVCGGSQALVSHSRRAH